MTTADKIKRAALEKLNFIVENSFVYLIDNHLSLGDFYLTETQLDCLTEMEKHEVKGCIEQLTSNKVEFYCKCQGIEIPEVLIRREK